MPNDMSTLARRLDDLERQNRRLRLILIGAVMALAAAGARAQVAPSAVTTDRVTLVDAQGRMRATLEMFGPLSGATRYPLLSFVDASGRVRIRFGVNARGPLLEIVDETGKTRDYFGGPSARPLTQ